MFRSSMDLKGFSFQELLRRLRDRDRILSSESPMRRHHASSCSEIFWRITSRRPTQNASMSSVVTASEGFIETKQK